MELIIGWSLRAMAAAGRRTDDRGRAGVRSAPQTRGLPSRMLLSGIGSADVGRVTREQLQRRVDNGRGVVHRGRRFAEADGNKANLAGVVDDVSGGEHTGNVREHRRVDEDVSFLQLETPLLDRTE